MEPTKIGEFMKESRVPGSPGNIAKKITVKLYGKGVFAKQENRPGSENTMYYARRAGQFIYSKLDFLNGAFGVIPDNLDGFETTVDLPCFDFVGGKVSPEWFLQYVSRPDFYAYQGGLGNGGRKARRISPDDFLELEIDLPPLPEQKKIAEILSGIDRNITIHLDMLQKLKIIHSGIFCEITKMKERANHVPLGQIISEITSGWSPTCSPATRTGERPAILKTTSITWEGYNPGENKILPAELQVKEEAVVRAGDILCTRKGPRERVGVVCYVEDTPPNLMVPDTAFRMRVNKGINPHFVSLVLSGQEIQEEWNRKKVGLAEAQVNINHGIINKTLIPIVPIEDQVRLTNAISGTRSAIRLQTEKINALRITKDALASDLLSGRKRISV